MDLATKTATAIDFIQSLQKAKAAQEIYKKKPWDHRAQIIQNMAEQIALHQSEISNDLSLEQKLPEPFFKKEILDATQKYLENLHLEIHLFPKPEFCSDVGIIGAFFSKGLAFMRAMMTTAKSLAAGNGIIISLPESTNQTAQSIQKILNLAQVPEGLVQILVGNQIEISKLLAGHPGLSAYQYYGDINGAEPLMLLTTQRKKKAQFFSGSKNSCLIHPEFDYVKNKDLIFNPFLIGSGQLDINCHRIFISQKVEKDFYEFLINSMKEISCELWSNVELDFWKRSVSQIKIDSGHILSGGLHETGQKVLPTWTRDLSNCSEMQQHQLHSPMFIVTAVKYTHEMIKWSNTGYHGHSALVLAPDLEKAKGMAAQLQVGHVHINEWTNFTRMGTPIKQSFWGNPDQSWSGSFYCDVKKF